MRMSFLSLSALQKVSIEIFFVVIRFHWGNDSVLNFPNKLLSIVPPAFAFFVVVFLSFSAIFCLCASTVSLREFLYCFLACLNFSQSNFSSSLNNFVNSIFSSFKVS